MWQNGITGGGLSSSAAISVDPNNNIWVANMATSNGPSVSGSVTSISQSGEILSQPNGYVTGVNSPSTITAAPDGSIWVGNDGSSKFISRMDRNGNPLSGNGFGSGILSSPSAIASDQSSNLWIADNANGNLLLMDQFGNVLKNIACCLTPDSLALDALGTVWAGDSVSGSITQVQNTGNIVTSVTDSRLNGARTLTSDGGGHLFIANPTANNIAILADSTQSNPATFVSPTAGLGLDATLSQPYGTAIDASGNLWVTSSGDNRLVRFVGLATPVKTPMSGLPQQP